MAMKRGKTLMAKALVRRSIKKAKRQAQRWDSRILAMNTDFAKRESDARAAKKLSEEEAARAATLGAEPEAA